MSAKASADNTFPDSVADAFSADAASAADDTHPAATAFPAVSDEIAKAGKDKKKSPARHEIKLFAFIARCLALDYGCKGSTSGASAQSLFIRIFGIQE